jgi:hypothetical protein
MMGKQIFKIDGESFEVFEGHNSTKKRKKIIHVGGDICPVPLPDASKYGLCNPYTKKGDCPELDKEWKQVNRQEVRNRKEVLDKVMKHIMTDVTSEQLKSIKWDSKAICQCGCSPGFVADFGFYGKILYINKLTPENVLENKNMAEYVD